MAAVQGRFARSSRLFLSAAYASCAARDPSTHPITMPMSSTAGMKMKWADVISPKFNAGLRLQSGG